MSEVVEVVVPETVLAAQVSRDPPGLVAVYRLAFGERERARNAPALPGTTQVAIEAPLVRLCTADLGSRSHLTALIVFLQDDVDDTAHGVGAVDRRPAIQGDLDTFDSRSRYRPQVGDEVLLSRSSGNATPVDQNERVRRPQAAQVGRRDTKRECAEVDVQRATEIGQEGSIADGRDVLRDRADDVLRRSQPATRDLLGVDHLDAACRVAKPKSRARDHDHLDIPVLVRNGTLRRRLNLLGNHTLRCRGDQNSLPSPQAEPFQVMFLHDLLPVFHCCNVARIPYGNLTHYTKPISLTEIPCPGSRVSFR